MSLPNNPNPIQIVKAIKDIETGKLSTSLGSSHGSKVLTTNTSGDITTEMTFLYSDGTVNTEGYDSLVLGNGIASGVAGNRLGNITLMRNTYFTQILPNQYVSDNISVQLPENEGTLLCDHFGSSRGGKLLSLDANGVLQTVVVLDSVSGTTSKDGYDFLELGNSTSTGVVGNKFGTIRIYGEGSYATSINANTLTSDTVITLPSSSGTLLVDSNLSISSSQSSGTTIGSITYNGSTTTFKVGKTLGTASEKGVVTSLTSSTTSTNLPTAKSVVDYIDTIDTCSTTATSISCVLPNNL